MSGGIKMGKSLKEIAKIASEWWADKVCHPKFDNGDNGEAGVMCFMMANIAKKDVEDESKQKFADLLKIRIEKELTERPEYTVNLDVDYHPCRILSEVGKSAGISDMNFPWKTYMLISSNSVSVAYGYQAPLEVLYANKAYWQGQIKGTEETLSQYESGEMCSWIQDPNERQKRLDKGIENCKERITQYKEELERAEE